MEKYTFLSFDSFFQILVARAEEAAEYEEISVDPGSKILPDLSFNKDRSNLFVISASKVSIHLILLSLSY